MYKTKLQISFLNNKDKNNYFANYVLQGLARDHRVQQIIYNETKCIKSR